MTDKMMEDPLALAEAIDKYDKIVEEDGDRATFTAAEVRHLREALAACAQIIEAQVIQLRLLVDENEQLKTGRTL